MSEAPASGLNFYVINKSFAQVTTNPPDNSVSTAKIVNSAVTNAKIGGIDANKTYWNWCKCNYWFNYTSASLLKNNHLI